MGNGSLVGVNRSVLWVCWSLCGAVEGNHTEVWIGVRGSTSKDKTNVSMKIEMARLGTQKSACVEIQHHCSLYLRDYLIYFN